MGLQLCLFYEGVDYVGMVETFYFHYVLDMKGVRGEDMPIYTGNKFGNTISLEKILELIKYE